MNTSTDRSTHPSGSRTFVLLPGAWSGPWAWEPVRSRLADRGHRVHTVSFSGLGPPGGADSIGLQTHVDDTLAIIGRHDLDEIVLVGHSYSGLIAGMVTDQAPRHIFRTVYVEGFLARHGRSLLDAFGEEQKARELADIQENHGWWPPPPPAAIAEEPDLTSDHVRWLAQRLVPHPARTITEPVELSRPVADQPSTYIAQAPTGTHLETLHVAHGWEVRHLEAGHWPMLSVPDQLTDVLVQAAASRAV
jgi:pimeloyl-ACP methyl ester carboxylesterase